MNKNILYVVAPVVVVLLFVFAVMVYNQPEEIVVGSIVDGQGYFSTTTRSHAGTELTNLTVLRPVSGIFGSVIITGANTGSMNFYDATTTNSSLRTKAATTTLASFPASTAANTYTLDLVFYDGLIFEETGLVATSTITWK